MHVRHSVEPSSFNWFCICIESTLLLIIAFLNYKMSFMDIYGYIHVYVPQFTPDFFKASKYKNSLSPFLNFWYVYVFLENEDDHSVSAPFLSGNSQNEYVESTLWLKNYVLLENWLGCGLNTPVQKFKITTISQSWEAFQYNQHWLFIPFIHS